MGLNYRNYREIDISAHLAKYNMLSPLDVMVTGVTGAGKSTTLNAFFQKNVAKVGYGVDPETMELDSYLLNDHFRLWDTPGLGDSVSRDLVHKKKMIDLLYKTCNIDGKFGFIDMVLVIIEGSKRDMGSTDTLLKEVIVPNIQSDRILIAINQADVAMKGSNWNSEKNEPNKELLNFLDKQVLSIQQRVNKETGVRVKKPIYYSAEYGWNIDVLFDFIIDNMPRERRKIMLK